MTTMTSSPLSTHRRWHLLPLVVALVLGIAGAMALTAPPANAASAPGKPTGVVGSALDAAVALTWKAPTSTGGSSITGYRVRYSSNNGSTWSASSSTGSKATTFRLTGLLNGAPYVFQVRAVNRVGSGSWSSKSASVTPVAATVLPPAPQPPAPQPPAPQPPAPENPVVPENPVAPTSTWWAPAKGTSWQVQFAGTLDTSVNAAVFDLDGVDTTAASVGALHAKGAKVICYFSAGSWEDWRSDAQSFPASVQGKGLDGWPGEKWLDVRQLSILLPIMERRILDCKAKGFDAVDPDNVDGYTQDSGFQISAADQIAYNKGLADLAHKHGLGIGLKNDPDQVKALEPFFDFSIAEECAKYNECNAYAPFTTAGKAVLHIEYSGTLSLLLPHHQGARILQPAQEAQPRRMALSVPLIVVVIASGHERAGARRVVPDPGAGGCRFERRLLGAEGLE